MTSFIIHFLICYIFFSALICILIITKKFFVKNLTSRTQYNLWLLLLILLIFPYPYYQV